MYARQEGGWQPQVQRFVNELQTWAGLHALGGYIASTLAAAAGGLLFVFEPSDIMQWVDHEGLPSTWYRYPAAALLFAALWVPVAIYISRTVFREVYAKYVSVLVDQGALRAVLASDAYDSMPLLGLGDEQSSYEQHFRFINRRTFQPRLRDLLTSFWYVCRRQGIRLPTTSWRLTAAIVLGVVALPLLALAIVFVASGGSFNSPLAAFFKANETSVWGWRFMGLIVAPCAAYLVAAGLFDAAALRQALAQALSGYTFSDAAVAAEADGVVEAEEVYQAFAPPEEVEWGQQLPHRPDDGDTGDGHADSLDDTGWS